MKIFVLFFAVLVSAFAQASQVIDGMYVNTFGDAKNPALVFVHGGPGFNSWDFELTTAPVLAEKGYFVVVYDQRGQGRSNVVPAASYTYKQYADDLKLIIDTLGLSQPVLLAHSHGSPISIQFDQYYPGVAKSIVLIAGTLGFGDTMKSMFENCAVRMNAAGDPTTITTLAQLKYKIFLDPSISFFNKAQAYGNAFALGMTTCGLYNVKEATPDYVRLQELLQANPIQGENAGNRVSANLGFLSNEPILTQNYTAQVIANKARYCGIYGDEDGLFTTLDLALIKNSVGAFTVIPGASHYIFIQQQSLFLEALKNTCGL